MASAIKMVSLERGHDPRRFALFAFGGAGPLHAAAVARALRIPRVLVPLYPGNASALGMLLADLRVDKVWTQAFKSSRVDAALVERQFAGIREAAVAELRRGRVRGRAGGRLLDQHALLRPELRARGAGAGRGHRPSRSAGGLRAFVRSTRSATATRSRAKRSSWSRSASPSPVAVRATPGCSREARRIAQRAGRARLFPRTRAASRPPIYRRYALPPGTRLDGPVHPRGARLDDAGRAGDDGRGAADGQLLIETGVA